MQCASLSNPADVSELLGGALMRLIMPLRRVSSLLPLGGSTIYPQMGAIGWSHLVTTRDCHPPSMAVGQPLPGLFSVNFPSKAQVDNRTVHPRDDWRPFVTGQLAGE